MPFFLLNHIQSTLSWGEMLSISRERQIIRYRVTTNIRRSQIKQDTVLYARGLQTQREHHIILTKHGLWPYTVTPSIDQTLHLFLTMLLIWTLLLNLTVYLIARGSHWTFAMGTACQQRTLTHPDTWSCPIYDLRMFFCWDHGHSIILLHHQFMTLSRIWLLTEFDFFP